jgi:two-component system, sensor histidine kinase and response regulator
MKLNLRKEAEDIIQKLTVARNTGDENFDKIVHELQVHQIELELQNDELKRTADELEISHKRYSDLFEYAPVGYMLLNDKTQILSLNISAASMLGFERSLLISRPLTLYIHPESQDEFYFHIQNVLANNERKTVEITFRKADGALFYAQVQSVKDYDAMIGSQRVRLAIIDISERKNIEIKLKRFRAAIDSSADNIFLVDYQSFCFIDINESACRNLGYTKKELLSLGLEAINFEYTRRQLINMLHDVFEQKQNLDYTMELKQRRKDGSTYDVEAFIKCVEIEGEKVIVVVARDITERIKTQEKLKSYTNELKELNASKDKFLSIISHDLRGPFLGLNGYTQMLIEDYDQLARDEVMDYLNRISDASRDLYNLVDNLLKWSRLELGKIPYEPMSFNLYEELEPLINLLTGVAQKKNIILENQIERNIFPYADRLMVISVTQNLLSNAIKFTPKGGLVKVRSHSNNGCVFVTIEDNGIGMNTQMAEKIFSLDKEFTTRGTDGEKGTGFGLIIAKEMVLKMGGKIWVKSEPEKGTIFTFSLVKEQNN